MRLKLVLLVHAKESGNVIPASYQYELSSCIFRCITENQTLYREWLQLNGFSPVTHPQHRLFSLSNFYIPQIKAEQDRLHILAPRVQLWMSFLPERGTESFIRSQFQGKVFTIGDKISRVVFQVDEITVTPPPLWSNCNEFVSLSPIVFSHIQEGRQFEFISPENERFAQKVQQNLLERYQFFYKQEFPHSQKCSLEILTPPKRKGIVIKRFTPHESKIIGYMFKFRLTAHPLLQRLIYDTGLGERISLGFGSIELLR